MKSIRTGLLTLTLLAGAATAAVGQQQQAAQQPNTLLSFERRQGYVLLFDGQTLEGWTTVGGQGGWCSIWIAGGG